MTTRRIGVNVQAVPPDADQCWQTKLPGVLLHGVALDPGVAERIQQVSPDTVIAMRYQPGGDDSAFIQTGNPTPKARAREFANNALPAFDRVRKYTSNLVQTYNELQIGDLREIPVPELETRAKRYAEGELELLRIFKAEGYRTIGFNMSRGTHHVRAFDPWSPFKIYEPVMADPAMDFFGYHAYWDRTQALAGVPGIMAAIATLWRYRYMYEEVSPAARKPIILTEFGEDGPGGFKNTPTSIGDYCTRMSAVESVWDNPQHFADQYVYLAFMYLTGHNDPRWDSFDPTDLEDERAAFYQWGRRGGAKATIPVITPTPPPQPQPPLADDALFAAVFIHAHGTLNVPYVPNNALEHAAYGRSFGIAISNEQSFIAPDGRKYIYQVFAGGDFAIVLEGDWGNVKLFTKNGGRIL